MAISNGNTVTLPAETDTIIWKKNGNILSYNDSNISINTANQQTILDVQSDIASRISVTNVGASFSYLDQNDGGGVLDLNDSTGESKVRIRAYGVSYFNVGNFGIGTTNPVSPLDVRKSASGEFGATIWNTASDGMGLYSRGGGTSSANTVFYFENYSGSISKSMMMNGDGNVGIGKTADYKLDVAGIVNAEGFYVNGVPFAGGGSQWTTSGSDIYYNGGNVGIGTTNPAKPLHIEIPNVSTNAQIRMTRIGAETLDIGSRTGIFMSGNGLDIGTTSAYLFRFYTNNTERMRIDTSGNVGIGTTNPISQLHIRNNTSSSIFTVESNGTGTPQILFFNDSTQYGLLEGRVNYFDNSIGDNLALHSFKGGIGFQTKNSNPAMIIDTSGNVGIGTTSPTHKLTVDGLQGVSGGGIGIKSYTGTGYHSIESQNGYLEIYSSLLDPNLVLGMNGNVGIGTTDPLRSLHVFGNIGIGKHWNQAAGPNESYQLELFSTGTSSERYASAVQTVAGDGVAPGNSAFQILPRGWNGSSYDYIPVATFSSTGNVGIGTTGPNSKLHVSGGDVYVGSIGSGVIIKSPDGTCYRITVANGGNLVTTTVTCP